MKLVNRTAVILVAEQPLVTWIKRKEPGCGMTLDRVRDEPTLYLLDEDAAEELHDVLARDYRGIWLAELRGWYVDAKLPRKGSYEDFLKWFTPGVLSMVVDVEGGPILRELM